MAFTQILCIEPWDWLGVPCISRRCLLHARLRLFDVAYHLPLNHIDMTPYPRTYVTVRGEVIQEWRSVPISKAFCCVLGFG